MKTAIAYIAVFLGLLIFIALVAALSAWMLMLLLGALAHLTGWHTAISFWACYVITFITSWFMPRGKSQK